MARRMMYDITGRIRPYRLGNGLHRCSRMRTTTLENSQIVLFQMQVFIWHDNDFCGTFPFHGLETLAFFILQQPNHCGVGADDDPLWLRAAADSADIAEY